jgi:predicted transcriptional regulator
MMTQFTIALPDDRLLKLKELATRLRLTPEDLVRASIEEIVSRPVDEFERAANFVLTKNAELYRRLA